MFKILIKSTGTYLKSRGNIGVSVFNKDGKLVYEFNSIKECALFFKVSDRTDLRALSSIAKEMQLNLSDVRHPPGAEL